ncbi:subclass B1 metallo-beta-lactamase [Crocinitomix catalasitica]|uniref:subclass B1 metallo-beta-lactamase n=1 Tax=Crocinitomix catalasitica TaxID=184607 RepID=UPI000684F8AF|nr:subclass B1 metallo-beta-lactamase [Crocinitomix catalasitica]
MKFNYKNWKLVLSLFIGLILLGCTHQKPMLNFESESLKIEQLTANTFVHISYLQTDDFGNVPCNGLIVIDNGEAIVYDTPVDDAAAKTLINWLKTEQQLKIKGIVVTHFHDDCLGGLNAFHLAEIPSYASANTIKICEEMKVPIPENGFENTGIIEVGNTFVENQFLGEGHTSDNIIGYFSKDKVLFGGCLIKEVGASEGYLGDANTKEWSNTVNNIIDLYPDVEVVVPGHGKPGGVELLTFTMNLFREK